MHRDVYLEFWINSKCINFVLTNHSSFLQILIKKLLPKRKVTFQMFASQLTCTTVRTCVWRMSQALSVNTSSNLSRATVCCDRWWWDDPTLLIISFFSCRNRNYHKFMEVLCCLFCLASSCVPNNNVASFSGLSILGCPFGFSIVYSPTRIKLKQSILDKQQSNRLQ